jgi:hypothetical protein
MQPLLELASTQRARRRNPHTQGKTPDISKTYRGIPQGASTGPRVPPPADDETDVPQISNPWSYNETRIMHLLFPRADSLCLNFGRTAVFQWNAPNSSTLRRTTACFLLAFYAKLSQSSTRVWPVILTSLRFLVGPGQDAGASKDKRASAARPRSYSKQTLRKIFSEPHLRRVRVVL